MNKKLKTIKIKHKSTLKTFSFFMALFFLLFGLNVNAQLNGINYINPSGANFTGNPGGTGGKTYTSFNNAISALVTYGISASGPGVQFIVSPGVYNEYIAVTAAISNTSTSRRITFDGQHKAVVKITTTSNNPTIRLYYASYFTFQNMTIENTSSSDAWAVNLQNYATNNFFNNCNIQVPVSSSINFIPVVFSNSTTSYSASVQGTDNNEFNNNTITGGHFGIVFYSYNTSSVYNNYNKFVGNDINNVYNYGYYSFYASTGTVVKNNIFRNFGTTTAYCIYCYYSTNITIEGNTMYPGTYGINLSYDNYYFTGNYSYIMNNSISNFSSASSNSGIYTYYSYNQYIYHNSVRVAGTSSNTSYCALRSYYCNYQTIKNNIFYTTGTNYLWYNYNCTGGNCDYNDWYYGGTSTIFTVYYASVTNNFTTLSAFVAYTSGPFGTHDVNSISTDPAWVSVSDLHRNASSLTLLQVPYISTCSTDIDGDSRSGSMANIGCDEIKPYDLDIQNMFPNMTAFVGQVPVKLDLVNNGYITLNATKLYLGYQVDGGLWVNDSFQMTSVLSSKGKLKYEFNTKWNITVDKIYRLCTRILPQISGDPDTSDMKCFNIKIGMAGIYTIDPAGSGPRNYTTFNAAVNDIKARTVGGECIFQVAQTSFNERVVITEIPGVSEINTVTFRGLNRYFSRLTYNYSGYPGNSTLVFNGANFIRFENMTIENTNTSYGVAIWFTNMANYNKISGCDVVVPPNTSSQSVNIYGGTNEAYPSDTSYYGDNGFNNVIENNLISGGGAYGGVTWFGGSYNTNYNNSFINNTFLNNYYYSLYFYQVAGNKINYNKISGPRVTSHCGICNYYTAADTVVGNIIKPGQIGIYQYYYNNNYAPLNWYSVIASNAISDFMDTNSQVGIYLNQNCYRNKVINNTIWVNGASNSYIYSTIYAYYPYYCDFTNNILINSGYEYLISLYYPIYCTCDYNDYYYPAAAYGGNPNSYPKFCFTPYSTGIVDFITFKSYINTTYLITHDINSYNLINPKVISNADLHLQPNNFGLLGQSQSLSTVPADMDMEPRCPFVSYLGADNPVFPKLSTGFMAYDTMCIFNPQIFYSMAESYVPHLSYWYLDNNFKTTNKNFVYVFTSPGVYNVKLKTFSCNGYDSFSKNIVISGSGLKPVVEFWTPDNVVEPDQKVKLFDVSKFCPDKWKWEITPDSVTDSNTGLKVSSFSYIGSKDTFQNPAITFYYPGEYSVCLTASNANGSGTRSCKTNYIIVKFVENMCSANVSSTKSYGTLYDDGGSTGDHGQNSSCKYTIKSCGDDIKLVFKEFDLAAGAFLRIYDGTSNNGSPMWNTAVYGNNGLTGMKGVTGWYDTLVATRSGMVYIEFTSGSNAPGAGFKIEWNTIGTGNYSKPVAGFDVEDTSCVVYPVLYRNTSTNCNPQFTDFRWDFNGDSTIDSRALNGVFNTSFSGISRNYLSYLIAENCGGIDTFKKVVILINPASNPIGDFHANVRHPVVSEDIVTFYNDAKRLSCVNTWHWKISPGTFYFINGTTEYSEHPLVIFADTTCYEVSLVMGNTNSLFRDSITKSCYIKPIKRCIPVVLNIHQDIGISRVQIGSINNPSPMGIIAYTSYIKTKQTNIVPGLKFTITIDRTTNFNPMNRSVWIDYNCNGSFMDPGELVAHEDSACTFSWTADFTVPSNAMLGATVMRIGTNYANFKNYPCGPNQFGEYEDYRLFIIEDNVPPELSIIGLDTVMMEKGYSYFDSGAVAMDNIEGNISGRIVTTNNIDLFKIGTYEVKYNVCDLQMNCITKSRTIIVTEDKTPPMITLIGKDTMYANVNLPFTDPFVTAYDLGDGNITSKVTTTGVVVMTLLGTYQLTYHVTDSKGLSDTKKRIVIVTDSMAPQIVLRGPDPMYVEIMHPYIDPGDSFFDNYWPDKKINHQVSGIVDTTRIGTYIVRYSVTDASGNGPNVITRSVIVYDSLAPGIILIAGDTVYMGVNTQYSDPGVSITDNSISGFKVHKQGSFYNNFPSGFADSIGNFSIWYQVEDAAGNLSNIIARVIKVIDNIAPKVKLIDDEYVTVQRWSTYVDKGYTVSDNYYKLTDLIMDTFSNVNPLENGLYQVSYTAHDPSGNYSPMIVRMVLVMEKTGVDETLLGDRINIYPNPSDGLFIIDIQSINDINIGIIILNSLGEEIMDVSNKTAESGKYIVDMSKYARGIYVVKVVTNEGTAIKRIMLAR